MMISIDNMKKWKEVLIEISKLERLISKNRNKIMTLVKENMKKQAKVLAAANTMLKKELNLQKGKLYRCEEYFLSDN